MQVIDTYNFYKTKYKEYVVLIKIGIFYEVYNNDVSSIYSFFNYKIRVVGNNYNIGFPINNITKVCKTLEENKINYIVIENNEITTKKKYNKNNYNKYKIDLNRLNYLNKRITNINKSLNNKINDKDIEDILFRIEAII